METSGRFGTDLQPLLDEVPIPVMTGNKIEIIALKQQAFNTIENRRVVAFSQVGRENAHHVASLVVEHPSEIVRLVVQFGGSLQHAVAGFLREPLGHRRVIEHQRDSRARESEIGRQLSQTNWLRWSSDRRLGATDSLFGCTHKKIIPKPLDMCTRKTLKCLRN
jgi:hypothetical protein